MGVPGSPQLKKRLAGLDPVRGTRMHPWEARYLGTEVNPWMKISNPLRPRAFGKKGADGMKKQFPAMQ